MSCSGFPLLLKATSASRLSTCCWAVRGRRYRDASPSLNSFMSPIPTSFPCLTECKHLVPVSAEAAPGSRHEAVKPAGHRHGQQRGHKHRSHRADEGLCVRRHFGLQAAQAGTQEHRGYAWAGGGAVRARGDQAGASHACPCLGTHLLVQTCKTLLPRPEPGWAAQHRVPVGAAVAAQGHGPHCPGFRQSGQPPEAGGAAGPGGCGASAILRLPCGCAERGRIRADGGVWRRPDGAGCRGDGACLAGVARKRIAAASLGYKNLLLLAPAFGPPSSLLISWPGGPGFLGNLSHGILNSI